MKTEVLIFLLGLSLAQSAITKKSSETSDTSPSDTTTSDASPSDATSSKDPPPAILAIEIVDSNSTEKNSTKRTIESALGYGYQSNYYPTSQGKRYMVYPYSQHDIPPATKNTGKYLARQTLNIQKSVSYNLGTTVEPAKEYTTGGGYTASNGGYTASNGGYTGANGGYTSSNAEYTSGNQEYYPSTLYSTVGQSGVIGGLSTNVPQQVQAATTIPVIILRVYTNQLSDPSALYPNLPQSHPYSNLNNINLQAIISNYLQQQMYQTQQYTTSNQGPVYQMYSQTPNYYYSAQQQQQTQQHQQQQQHQENLPTHENYPSNSHTRVIYHGPKGHVQVPQYSKTAPQTTYSSQYNQAPQYTQAPQYATQAPQYATQAPQYASSSPQNSQYVYTDTNGQNYIYVDPSQLQQGQYYPQDYQQQDYQQDYQQQEYQQQEYQQQEYQQQEYQSQQPQDYKQQDYQQEYQQVYQKAQEDRKYLPASTSSSQKNPEKVYNYHAEAVKDRTKKSSGSPVTFEAKKIESKNKS